jgi:hypothetical protein
VSAVGAAGFTVAGLHAASASKVPAASRRTAAVFKVVFIALKS